MADQKGEAAVLTEISLILAAVFWGTNYAATKYAAEYLPQMPIVAFRFTVGGLLLLFVLRLLEPESGLERDDVLPMLGLGCLGVATAQTAFTFGISLTSASNTGLVFATAPVWGLLLGLVLGLERPSRRGILGVALSISGIDIIFHEGLVGAEDASLLGDLLILVAAIGVGAYTVFSMPVLQRHSPLAVATYPTLFGAPVVLLLASSQLPSLDWGVGAGAWAAVGFSAVFATAFAFAAWQGGHKPHRGQPGAHLPVPDHPHRGRLGHRLLRREPRDEQARGRCRHPPRCLSRPAPVRGDAPGLEDRAEDRSCIMAGARRARRAAPAVWLSVPRP